MQYKRNINQVQKNIETCINRPISFKEYDLLFEYNFKDLKGKINTLEILKNFIEIEGGGIILSNKEYFRVKKFMALKRGNKFYGIIQFRNNKKREIVFKNIKRDLIDNKREYLTIFKIIY